MGSSYCEAKSIALLEREREALEDDRQQRERERPSQPQLFQYLQLRHHTGEAILGPPVLVEPPQSKHHIKHDELSPVSRLNNQIVSKEMVLIVLRNYILERCVMQQ